MTETLDLTTLNAAVLNLDLDLFMWRVELDSYQRRVEDIEIYGYGVRI